MRAFPVDLPSGARYWTVLDDDLCAVPVADQWLRFLRFGRSRTELTTRSYASGAAFYFRWCGATGRRWEEAAADMGLFMVWLRYSPSRLGAENPTVVWEPGTKPVRGERRVNGVLAAVRGLLSYAVSVGAAPRSVLGQLYELADSRDLPAAQNDPTDRVSVVHPNGTHESALMLTPSGREPSGSAASAGPLSQIFAGLPEAGTAHTTRNCSVEPSTSTPSPRTPGTTEPPGEPHHPPSGLKSARRR